MSSGWCTKVCRWVTTVLVATLAVALFVGLLVRCCDAAFVTSFHRLSPPFTVVLLLRSELWDRTQRDEMQVD